MPKIAIPEKLKCPITHELFKEPVVAKDGHTYEKTAIEKWVQAKGTSPITREKMAAEFVPNWDKKKQLSRFFEKAKLCREAQFFAAVKSGEVEHVKQLNYLDAHLEAKDKNNFGRTPLHWAAVHGHESIVKLLLSKNANIEAQDNYGNTPLHWAVESGQESSVTLLLREGAAIEAKNTYGDTPLHWAAENGQESTVTLLLREHANTEAQNDEGNTPLHLAAEKGHTTVVKLLLAKGAPYKAANQAGQTPAALAAQHGKLETASLIHPYHQKLKNEAQQAPAEIAELKQTVREQEQRIRQQDQRIQQLEQQLQHVLSHLNRNPAGQLPANTTTPAFFKR